MVYFRPSSALLNTVLGTNTTVVLVQVVIVQTRYTQGALLEVFMLQAVRCNTVVALGHGQIGCPFGYKTNL